MLRIFSERRLVAARLTRIRKAGLISLKQMAEGYELLKDHAVYILTWLRFDDDEDKAKFLKELISQENKRRMQC